MIHNDDDIKIFHPTKKEGGAADLAELALLMDSYRSNGNMEKAEKLEIPPSKFREFENYCSSIPCLPENSQLFAVFDGLGGEVFGEKASFLASDVFLQQFEKLDKLIVNGKEFFSLACSKAEKEITERINKEFICS